MQDYIETLVSKREELGRTCRVFLISNTTTFFQCLKHCVQANEDVIGVITETLDKAQVEPLKSMATYHRFCINLVIIDPQEAVVPLLQHVLHDKHWFVGTSEEVKRVDIRGKITDVHELPTLLVSDPVCMWYGFRAGDIVCCNTIQPFSTSTECFQLVKHDMPYMTGSLRGV